MDVSHALQHVKHVKAHLIHVLAVINNMFWMFLCVNQVLHVLPDNIYQLVDVQLVHKSVVLVLIMNNV